MFKKPKFYIITLYVICTIIFFVLFHFSEVFNTPYEFLFIVANCILAAILLVLDNKYFPYLFVPLGLLFTVGADTFLVILRGRGNFVILGVLLFCLAQICYSTYINWKKQRTKKQWLAIISFRAIPFILTLLVLYIFCRNWMLFMENQLLILIAGLYAILSVANIGFSLVHLVKQKTHFFIFVGLVLLLICDIFVMISFLGISMPVNFAWMFYIPSQMFIVLEAAKLVNNQNSPASTI